MSYADYSGHAFEELCKKILVANNWKICSSYAQSSKDIGVDIVAQQPESEGRVIFEVKYARSGRFPTSALRHTALRTVQAAKALLIKKVVLLIGADIRKEIQCKIKDEFKIQIIDLNGILSLASVDLNLLEQVLKLCEVDLVDRDIKSKQTDIIKPNTIVDLDSDTSTNQDDKGSKLINQLQEVQAGKDGWREYEETIAEILLYLFDENLKGWHKQKVTTDKLHRYDLVCRVIENSPFWEFISQDLDSRYVLFEFKNFKKSIKQPQIYSTEKYLYEKAKRKVCFLISRKGMSENAIVACQGAVREHGKLIVDLNDESIIELINAKMKGDDHNDILFDKLDNFLMELPR